MLPKDCFDEPLSYVGLDAYIETQDMKQTRGEVVRFEGTERRMKGCVFPKHPVVVCFDA